MSYKIKIGVLGIGAIGSVMAFELIKNKDNELFFYSRTQKKRLKIISEKAEFEIQAKVETSVIEPPKLDWLIICLKEYHYSDAKEWFLKLINTDTKIAVVRNGLRLKQPLLAFTTENNILECIIDAPTESHDTGFYQLLKKPTITAQNSDLADAFKNLFNENQFDINLTSDFKTESWQKLIESSALGAILCLSGETCWIFKDKNLRDLHQKIIEESLVVAKADGAIIESDFTYQMMHKLSNYPQTKGSSMLTDRLNRNPIELNAKNGIIAELGRELNVKTPLNDLMIHLMKHTDSPKKLNLSNFQQNEYW